MPVPIVYRQGSDAVASYDWVDITSGAGYKRFYPTCAIHTAGASYYLSPKLIDAPTLFSADLGTFTKNDGAGSELDLDFDVTFGKPATIAAAAAHFSFTVQINDTKVSTATINIYHVTSGGTETSIGTVTGKARTPVSATYTRMRELLTVTLTRKAFAVGEKLRINYISTLTDSQLQIWHDPNSRNTFAETTTANIGSDFIADIPFQIDL